MIPNSRSAVHIAGATFAYTDTRECQKIGCAQSRYKI